jgi:Holliday junction resolvase RusA-like endonuclease
MARARKEILVARLREAQASPELLLNESVPVVVSIVHPGTPVSTMKARTVQGRHYTPEKAIEYREALASRIRRACRTPLDDESDFRVDVRFHIFNAYKNDVDNLAKIVMDVCTGIVWADDSQVTDLRSRVRRGVEDECVILDVRSMLPRFPRWTYCKECGQRLRIKSLNSIPSYCGRVCVMKGWKRGSISR